MPDIDQQKLADYVREQAGKRGFTLPEHDVRRIVRDVRLTAYTLGDAERMAKRAVEDIRDNQPE